MINTDNGFEGLGFRSVLELNQEKDRTELGQEDFLELMTTQLENQDPFEPMENGQFLQQIAQFSTVSGIKDLQESFSQLSQSLVSNQALQASNIVGRSVLAPTGIGHLGAGSSIDGVVELPASSQDVNLTVMDPSGQVIRRLPLGGQPAGPTQFSWDGFRDDGQPAAPGTYFLSAEANYDGRDTAVETLVASEVQSVTLGNGGGLLLDLRGVGTLDFAEVRQIY